MRNVPNIRVGGVILIFPWNTAIDRLTIYFQPRAHLTKAFFEDWHDFSVGGRCNVDQCIASRTKRLKSMTSFRRK